MCLQTVRSPTVCLKAALWLCAVWSFQDVERLNLVMGAPSLYCSSLKLQNQPLSSLIMFFTCCRETVWLINNCENSTLLLYSTTAQLRCKWAKRKIQRATVFLLSCLWGKNAYVQHSCKIPSGLRKTGFPGGAVSDRATACERESPAHWLC